MTTAVVTSQQALDQALANPDVHIIHIKSERGIWINLSTYGSATVRAYGSATVEAYDSATVRAYDSATVEAYGSATVEAYDSATVEAYGSATVHARHSTTVTASPHVAVHLHSARVTVTGGVVIDVTALDLNDPRTWCEHRGVDITDGGDQDMAVLYKAVDEQLTAGQQHCKPTTYTIGTEVTCDDWRDDHSCGGGLHVSPRPYQAGTYTSGSNLRYLKVLVPVDQLRPIGADKCKTPTLFVAAEVDSFARELAAAVTA